MGRVKDEVVRQMNEDMEVAIWKVWSNTETIALIPPAPASEAACGWIVRGLLLREVAHRVRMVAGDDVSLETVEGVIRVMVESGYAVMESAEEERGGAKTMNTTSAQVSVFYADCEFRRECIFRAIPTIRTVLRLCNAGIPEGRADIVVDQVRMDIASGDISVECSFVIDDLAMVWAIKSMLEARGWQFTGVLESVDAGATMEEGELQARIEQLERENYILRDMLCPHMVRYGRACDDGLTDHEIQALLER